MGDVILTMKGIDKSFPGVHALDHVDLEIRKGDLRTGNVFLRQRRLL